MGTTGAYAETTEVRRDEPNRFARLNAAAIALQVPGRLEANADDATVNAFKAKIQAAVDGVVTK